MTSGVPARPDRDAIAGALARVRGAITAACQAAGRDARAVTLIAVSKTVGPAGLEAALDAGHRTFGENRVQEGEGKYAAVQNLEAAWHLVGHLQSNKATRAAKIFHTIDSVDDFALAQRLDRARAELASGSRLRVLLEVRLAPETSKSGAASEDLQFLAQKIVQLPNLDLAGLMCIPPFLDDPEQEPDRSGDR